MRLALKTLAGVLGVYLAAAVALMAIMCRPPEQFAKIVAKLPGPVLFAAFPFERLWFIARAGHLKPGSEAPDFELQTLDKQSRVRLSAFRGRKPVVLIFGSYT